MPFPIKYKSGNLTGSLQKGNVALAINNINLGPTSTTGWYNGPNYTSGTYQIIETAASGDPDVYCPQNDSELITFVKWKGATGSNTGSAAAALAWIATQSNLMAVNNTFPNIVTDGMVLNLTANTISSYPTTGITWYDVSGGSNNGTLTNGPTFNSSGYIQFDGVDDYINASSTNNTYSSLTFIALVNTSTQTGGAGIVFNRGGGGSTTGMNILYPNGGSIGYHWNDDSSTYLYNPGLSLPNNRWCFCCVSVSPTQAIFQINGSSVVRSYTNPSPNTTIGGNLMVGADAAISRYYQSKISNAQIYNRALSQAEILQNYHQGNIVTDGLVMAVDAGNLVSYESGSSTTYSLTGSVSGSLTNGTSYNSGNGGVWNFDGVDDYIEFPFETILNDCSFEVWFKATSTRTYQYPLAIRNNGVGSSYAFYLDINDPDGNGFAQTMWVYWNSGGTPYSVVPKTGTYGDWNDSTWRHYVFTRSTTVAPYTEHYMNGVKVTNVSRNGDQTTQFGNGTGYKLYLGQYGAGALYYPGYQAIVRIYNKTLSSAEVAQNYNATKGRFGL